MANYRRVRIYVPLLPLMSIGLFAYVGQRPFGIIPDYMSHIYNTRYVIGATSAYHTTQKQGLFKEEPDVYKAIRA